MIEETKQFIINEINDQKYEELEIKDEDDLHDFCLLLNIGNETIEENDYLYHKICGEILPQIAEYIIDYLNTENDYYLVLNEQREAYYEAIKF